MEWHLSANVEALSARVIKGVLSCYYSAVNRANNVIESVNYVKDISSENRALYIAEAKVLRAYYYTYLWKMWGNIPCYKKNLEFPYTSDQSSADEVYHAIIEDLDEAIKDGGLPMKATADTYGRITKAMAYMLYAEVVMYQKDNTRYSTALNYMNEIIESGSYDLNSD